MKWLGLSITLTVTFVAALLLFNNQEHSGKSRPESYKVMDVLETEGVYGRNYSFESLKNETITVKEYEGKVIIFSFWATWCEPCVEEFPSLIRLLDAFPDKVVLFAISHDDDPKDVKNFIDAFQGWRKNLKVVFDRDKKVSRDMEVDRLPEGYVFDPQGKLVKKILGIQDWATKGALRYFEKL